MRFVIVNAIDLESNKTRTHMCRAAFWRNICARFTARGTGGRGYCLRFAFVYAVPAQSKAVEPIYKRFAGEDTFGVGFVEQPHWAKVPGIDSAGSKSLSWVEKGARWMQEISDEFLLHPVLDFRVYQMVGPGLVQVDLCSGILP